MANTHAERGTVIPDFHIKLPPKNTVSKIVAYVTGGAVLATGIGYGVDKFIRSQNNNFNPNDGITPITTEGTMPSQETTIPTTTETTIETTKPTETTPTPTTETEVKIDVHDLTSYGLKYNSETEKYETIDNRYGIETKDAVEIISNVKFGNEITEGFEVDSTIVKNLLKKEKELKIALPIDPGNTDNLSQISINSVEFGYGYTFKMLKINTPVPCDVINTASDSINYLWASNSYYGICLKAFYPFWFYKDGEEVKPNSETPCISILWKGNLEKVPFNKTNLKFSDVLENDYSGEINIAMSKGSNPIDLTLDKVLTMDGKPVFVKRNKN